MYSRSPIEWGAAGATAAHSQQLSNIIVQHIGGTQTLTHIYPIETTLQILYQSIFPIFKVLKKLRACQNLVAAKNDQAKSAIK